MEIPRWEVEHFRLIGIRSDMQKLEFALRKADDLYIEQVGKYSLKRDCYIAKNEFLRKCQIALLECPERNYLYSKLAKLKTYYPNPIEFSISKEQFDKLYLVDFTKKENP